MTDSSAFDAPTDVDIGVRLRAARLQVAMTQEELAQALGVDRSTVAKWESGQRGMTVENLIRAAAIVATSPHDLLVAPAGAPAARPLTEVIVEQQTAQAITRTLAERPEAIPVVIAALKHWAQSVQGADEPQPAELHGSYATRMIVQQLYDVDITVTTPLRALQLIHEWQQLIAKVPRSLASPEP